MLARVRVFERLLGFRAVRDLKDDGDYVDDSAGEEEEDDNHSVSAAATASRSWYSTSY